jgi:asparagine synthase (glutamine-hydrolysing)
MCGIAGILNPRGPIEEELLNRMCRALEHRGPDSGGTHLEPGVGLGCRRLAIIDIEGGDQPIFNEDGTVAVVMNGEIYNHVELRKQLLQRGHRFRSRVDTEVLVHLYEDRGERLVEELRGMFAFAIWDRRRQCLLLGRDRVGKKPLFWAQRGGVLLFASELRSLLQDPELARDVDPRAIDAYLTLQYVPHPLSAFRSVSKLPPATVLRVEDARISAWRYWRLDHSRKINLDKAELEERIRSEFWEATRLRLMSEVPLGVFLSGGIDSSGVVAAMAENSSGPVKTFSIGFPDQDFDEVHYARLVAERFATDHHEFQVRPEALSIMPKLARHYGEPFGDPSAIPTFYLAEMASRHVTVALNGDGGDESFAGYPRYIRGRRLRALDAVPAPIRQASARLVALAGTDGRERSVRKRASRLAEVATMDPWERYASSLVSFTRPQRDALLSDDFKRSLGGFRGENILASAWASSPAAELVDRMMDVDIETYLPGDLLPKVDIATMAHSLEARSPFLDHVLMELAASVPAKCKLDGASSKRALKSALRGIVPNDILVRSKMGFGVPLSSWFRHELRELPGERLLDPSVERRGYLQRGLIERMIREHHAGSVDHSLRLWLLLQLDSWHREVVEAPIVSSEPVR